MQQYSPRNIEGFEQTEQDLLTSKEKEKKRQTNLYFQIPEAKPLLTKNYIDYSKPKVLIRQIKINKECAQLTQASFIITPHPTDKPLLGRRDQIKLAESTLWKRFIASKNYKCYYMKHYTGNMQDLDQKTNKKLKYQISKLAHSNEHLFATYVIDMNFLNESGTYLLKNLQDNSQKFEQQRMQSQQLDIQFDSRFQCGNLMYVFKKGDQSIEPNAIRQYFLILQNDVNTRGYANWFYFKISSKKAGKFKLHIVNIQKNYSYFGYGMRPVIYSLQKHVKLKTDWHYDGYNISYHHNQLLKSQQSSFKYNTLNFTIDQIYDNDVIYIAANVPYSYSRLVNFIDGIQKISKLNNNIYFRKQALALSVSSNQCPLLTITWKRQKKKQQFKLKKKVIIILARQHPSQIVSSFVMEGFINQLVYLQQESSVDLLKRYIFKIVPMVNIDGVIYGNSRCDISGSDGNRKWTKNPNTFLYPIISAIKKLANNLIFEGSEIQYFIDLHGHSRKLGSFIYGCKGIDDTQNKIFSWIMSKICPKFVFEDCKFGLSNFRKQTARGCMNGLLDNRKSMTLQTSFYGYKYFGGVKPFEIQDLRQIGGCLLQAIHIDTFRNNKLINWGTVRAEIKNVVQRSNKNSQDQEDQSGSDSNPEGDDMTQKQKSQTFLTPATASKIGLYEVKVVERAKKSQLQSKEINLFDFQDSLGMFQNNHDTLLNQRYLQSEMLNKIEKPNTLKQSKSVTKIEPFKFKSLQKKKSLSLNKKIRIAIDIQRVQQKEQLKLLSPTLPKVSKRDSKQFWSNLKKEFDYLVSQKQMMIKTQRDQPVSKKISTSLFRKQTY